MFEITLVRETGIPSDNLWITPFCISHSCKFCVGTNRYDRLPNHACMEALRISLIAAKKTVKPINVKPEEARSHDKIASLRSIRTRF